MTVILLLPLQTVADKAKWILAPCNAGQQASRNRPITASHHLAAQGRPARKIRRSLGSHQHTISCQRMSPHGDTGAIRTTCSSTMNTLARNMTMRRSVVVKARGEYGKGVATIFIARLSPSLNISLIAHMRLAGSSDTARCRAQSSVKERNDYKIS